MISSPQRATTRSQGAVNKHHVRVADVRNHQKTLVAGIPQAHEGGQGASSSASSQVPANDADASLRQALAKREAWNEPRRLALEPVKVQDPPVDQAGQLPDGGTTAPKTAKTVKPAEVRVARNEPLQATEGNDDLIREAILQRGKPYIWGGASRSGFDCSGFVCYIFQKMRGKILPHSASAQARMGTPVAREALQPGDLVFFSTYRPGISHVGIYIGENKFVHAANHRADTRIDSLTGYYANRYKWARRLSPAPMRFSPQELQRLMDNSSEVPQADAP